ncbi:MAG: glycosyltransferase family 39 protein [Elusimicrobiota bacterium]|nr:MAG: glycosyltransferase family 39 protein [Elusimicrobiota bacterium]
MAAGFKTFGPHERSFRIPSILLDTLSILLIFLLGREFFGDENDTAGIMAAYLYALNPLMIRLVSGTVPDDSVHVINTFFITLSAYLFAVCARVNRRSWAVAGGVSVGLGTLCLSGIGLLGFAAAIPLLYRSKAKRLWPYALGAFLLAALPWPLYASSRWPELYRHESALQFDHLLHALEGHAHAWWWYLKLLPVHFAVVGTGWLVWPALAAVLAYALKKRSPGVQALLLWVGLPYVFFSLIATKLYSYPCASVAAVCLLAGLAGAAAWRRGPLARGAVALALLALAVPRLRADYSAPVWSTTYDYAALRAVSLKIGAEPGKKVVLNVKDHKSAQVMYYSGVPAYPDAPTPALVKDLRARGYRVFVFLEEGERVAAPGALLVPLPAPLAGPVLHPYEA